MSILTVNHYINEIDSFIADIRDTRNSYYVFVGRPQPWANNTGGDDDTAVLAANGSVNQYELTIYDDLLYGKLISTDDVSYMIPRINWTSGTVYARYDQDDPILFDKQFYVMNDNYEVYKCINNNKGAQSIVRPSLTSTTGTFMTSDGYVWKFMYKVSNSANTKFTSNYYIPVTANSDVSNNAIKGTIDSVIIADGGSNYKAYETGYIQAFVDSRTIQLPNTSSIYDNFYVNSSIYLKSGYGSGQIREIETYNGVNKRLNVSTSEPFNTFTHLELTNVVGSLVKGELVYQKIDTIQLLYTKGYFNIGDTIVQTYSNAAGVVLTVNSAAISVSRTTEEDFVLNYPLRSTSDSGTKKNGKVNITNSANSVNSFSVTFGSNSQYIQSSNDFIYLGASVAAFANNDEVLYKTASGNTVIPGLTNNTFYYVAWTNSTGLALSSTLNGANINITANGTSTETGHSLTNSLQGVYSVGDFIRIGDDANSNIRRVTAVTNTSLSVDLKFTTSLTSANHYLMTTSVSEPSSITKKQAEGYVVDYNLNGIKINISNSSITGKTFTIGEKVNLVNQANVNQGANGIVAYANLTTVVLSDINGSWTTGANLFMRGDSSLLLSNVDLIASYPNITLGSPSSPFVTGQQIHFSLNNSETGNATIISQDIIPNGLTEYVIGPTVKINGDGSNAKAYAVVNTALGGGNSVISVVMLNPGSDYTKADINIYANSTHGSGANVLPIISPVLGHGKDAITELGARYAGISVNFANSIAEGLVFPSYGSFRRVGIIHNPKFDDVLINLDSFDRVKLIIENLVNSFANGEIVINAPNNSIAPYTNAAGVVVYSNSTYLELKNVSGTFTNASPHNKLFGLSSNATANIANAAVARFTIGSTSEIVSEIGSGANGEIVQILSNTQIKLSNVYGQFVVNDTIYDASSNAYANVVSIYTSNGRNEASTDFGLKFNQTARITLMSNTGAFQKHEYVTQDVSGANGRVISTTDELDLVITLISGTFSNSQLIYNTNTGANGYALFANSTYIKLTGVSNNTLFTAGNYINNGLGSNAVISQVRSVLVLSDVNGSNKFQAAVNNITGQNSGAVGVCTQSDLITYPNLIRESGEVIYIENVEPVTRTRSSQEQFRLVIKF